MAMFMNKFTARIILPAALSIVLLSGTIFSFLLPCFEETLIARKKQMVQEVVTTVHSLLGEYKDRVDSGELALSEAQSRAIKRISHMRYGAEAKDYFWINTMEPRMVMHPYRPELEGENLSRYADSHGKLLFVEAVAVVKENGSGFVDYMWQWKDDPRRIVSKISYVKGFKPWGWVVGSGIYVEDVYAEISSITRRLALILSLILLVTVLVTVFIIVQVLKAERLKEVAEAKLRASEKKYRELVQDANSIILRLDKKGAVLFMNEFAQDFFGFTENEIIGRSVVGTIVPEISSAGQNLKKFIDGLCADPRQYLTNENENIKKGGERVWIAWTNKAVLDESGAVKAILCVGNNITERKRAEQELREQEYGFRKLFDNMTNAVVIYEPAEQGRNFLVKDVNRAAQQLEQLSKEDLIGKHLSTIFPAIKESGFFEVFERVFKTGQPEYVPEKLYRDDRLGEVWRENWIYKLPGGDIVSIYNDVTQKRIIRQEALRSARLASIGELAAGVAHEVNNPLNGIINCAELITDTLSKQSLDTKWAVAIIRESRRIARIVQSLLAYARPRDEQFELVTVKRIFEETFLLLQKHFEKNFVSLAVEIPENLPQVSVQSQKIQEVFMNIMSNALYALNKKYGSSTGKKILKIGAENKASEGRFYVRIVFSDNGVGIPKKSLGRICELFYSLKPAGEGTGLGLNICYNIIKEHDGGLFFESDEGHGTRVIVDLPVARD